MKLSYNEIREKIKGIKKEQWFVFLLAGILILVILMPVEDKNKEGTEEKTDEAAEQTQETYLENLEQRIAKILKQMDGVGEAQVMITLKNDGTAKVEKDVSESGAEQEKNREEETVYTEGDVPFIVSNDMPAVEGVLVVCDGGGNAAVQQNIIDAVMALFPIDSHKIKVVKRAGGQR